LQGFSEAFRAGSEKLEQGQQGAEKIRLLMILSFHPCFVADRNIICAGREPNDRDLGAIRDAAAVVLPQGCGVSLYRLARQNCAHVFPNLDAKFDYPGKIGQIRLFREIGVRHPASMLYGSLQDYLDKTPSGSRTEFGFPLVLKYDWGGEGESVFLLRSAAELGEALSRIRACEATGQKGFIFQEYLASQNRALRVAVIGREIFAYWRVQKDPAAFGTSLAKGAVIEHRADLPLQAKAVSATREFCRRTGINLAGFDFLYAGRDLDAEANDPYFLEINFFFGRNGLGGSANYYRILTAQIDLWLKTLGLATCKRR
jgi:ribosomal protein S6--L-glutamate ligase